jgi:hypothetical protein
VSQNDWHKRCECKTCLQIEEEEGSPSGPLLRFVNAIAEDVERDYPRVAIDTLAYMYTRKAPKITRPRPNVIVRLCSIECSFLQPLTHDVNKAFRDDILEWSKICNRLYIWDYVTNFQHYLMPHPNLRVLEPNIRFFVDHGVKGILEQGNNRTVGGEFQEMRAWILAKMLWNPDLEAETLIEEFTRGCYGKAAPHLLDYLNLIHDRAEPTGYYLDLSEDMKAPFLNTELLAKADAFLHAALLAVADNQTHSRRVECAALATKYVFAVRWPYLRREAELNRTPWPLKETRDDLIGQIERVCVTNKISWLREDFSGDATPHIETFKRRFTARREATRPDGFQNVPLDDFIDLQDDCAQLWVSPKSANWVQDESASDAKAIWMSGDHKNWSLGLPLNDPTLKSFYSNEWTAYAVVRVEKLGEDGDAFSCGIHDRQSSKQVLRRTVKCAEASAQYQAFKLGDFTPGASHYFWAAPASNAANVKSIWIDRLFLVRKK